MVLELDVKRRTDYLHFYCKACGVETENTYLGYKRTTVPSFKFFCPQCKKEIELKGWGTKWHGLPHESTKDD